MDDASDEQEAAAGATGLGKSATASSLAALARAGNSRSSSSLDLSGEEPSQHLGRTVEQLRELVKPGGGCRCLRCGSETGRAAYCAHLLLTATPVNTSHLALLTLPMIQIATATASSLHLQIPILSAAWMRRLARLSTSCSASCPCRPPPPSPPAAAAASACPQPWTAWEEAQACGPRAAVPRRPARQRPRPPALAARSRPAPAAPPAAAPAAAHQMCARSAWAVPSPSRCLPACLGCMHSCVGA
jgi:hypothetical protein